MQPLNGVSVLVTRPHAQCEALAQKIEALGGTAICAPMIIVAALDDETDGGTLIETFARSDIVIFISRNAVEFGLDMTQAHDLSLQGKQVLAVGLGTAAALNTRGVGNVEVPDDEFSTEGLLRLEALAGARIERKSILIFRGRGGRELLARTLEKRGARVDYCECYERRKPSVVIAAELEKCAVKAPDIGLATSVEAFNNLVEKLDDEGIEHLFDMQMLVVGSRVAAEVESFGFTHAPLVVENPSDESIIKRLIKWAYDEL